MPNTYLDPNIYKPSVKPMWAKKIALNRSVELNEDVSIEWIPSSRSVSYKEIKVDGADIIERRKESQNDAFSQLLVNPEFIEEVIETDKLFETDPGKFTDLSNLYRKIKKS